MNTLHLFAKHLDHNYEQLRKKIDAKTLFIAVIKAQAYGSHLGFFAKRLEQLGADAFAVAYTEEGKQLRAIGIKTPILVFYPQISTLSQLIEAHLEPCLYNTNVFMAVQTIIRSKGLHAYPVHIKYNTGLNRVGFTPEQSQWILKQLEHAPFQVKSVYSHLAASEEKRPSALCDQQIECFSALRKLHLNSSKHTPFFHLLNSSGVFNYPEYQYDAVRCGIALHGYANHSDWDDELLPVATLTSKICQLTEVKKGASVGYDHGWVAEKDTRIATLPIGHADGIGRHFGKSNTSVFIHGKAVPIVGNICMDLLMIDVTAVECAVGDEVELFGSSKNAAVFAQSGATISYEILTQLGVRIERKLNL